jgi:hypothetical protein
VVRIRDEFLVDPGGVFFLLQRLLPETIRSMKKCSFYFSSLLLCRIRDEKCSDMNPMVVVP